MPYSKYSGDTVDFGPGPAVIDILCATKENPYYRRVLWTGEYLQVTLMCIPPCKEIGLEVHCDNDQFLRIEQGMGMVMMGKCRENLNYRQRVCPDDAIFVPAGTWHNVVNTGKEPLKLYSIYAPPHHPRGIIDRTKADADEKKGQ